MAYRFKLSTDAPEKLKVHVIVKSTLDFLNVGGHEYTLSLDGGEPVTVNFNRDLVDREPHMYTTFYPTVARRVVESVVELSVHSSDVHELVLRPRHYGIVFEKIVIDFGGYREQYLFGRRADWCLINRVREKTIIAVSLGKGVMILLICTAKSLIPAIRDKKHVHLPLVSGRVTHRNSATFDLKVKRLLTLNETFEWCL